MSIAMDEIEEERAFNLIRKACENRAMAAQPLVRL